MQSSSAVGFFILSSLVLVKATPICREASIKYPSENGTCEQYYECVQHLWWYNPVLKTCPTGQAFDIVKLECVDRRIAVCEIPASTSGITESSHTSTQRSPTSSSPTASIDTTANNRNVTTVSTTGSNNINATKLSTVASTPAINTTANDFHPSTVHSTNTTTTRTKSTQTTINNNISSTISPVKPSVCHRLVCRTPALLCYQYYETYQHSMLPPQLKTCPSGQGYAELMGQCVPLFLIDCTRPVPTPECFGPGRYQASTPNQYYECVRYFWFWYPVLKTCRPRETFNQYWKTCFVNRF